LFRIVGVRLQLLEFIHGGWVSVSTGTQEGHAKFIVFDNYGGLGPPSQRWIGGQEPANIYFELFEVAQANA
jgi:hypothetical protein